MNNPESSEEVLRRARLVNRAKETHSGFLPFNETDLFIHQGELLTPVRRYNNYD
jgi:hypothetical protein